MDNEYLAQLYNKHFGGTQNAIANNSAQIGQQQNVNPFAAVAQGLGDRVGSIGNALGTTGAAALSPLITAGHKGNRNKMMMDNKEARDKLAQKYGYENYTQAMEAGESAPAEMWTDFQNLSKGQMEDITDLGNSYENNAIVKHINNTSRNKFGSDAIKTLSTAADVGIGLATGGMSIPAQIAMNSGQGVIEGFADELGNIVTGKQIGRAHV